MRLSNAHNHIPMLLAIVMMAIGVASCSKHFGNIFHKEEPFVVSPLAEKLGFSMERPLILGMNTSYAPLQYVDDQGRPSGYDVKFTRILMRRMGIPFTFSPNIWEQMSPGIIGGKYDMGMLVYSSYRKDLTNYSNAVFRLYYQIVYRKKDFTEFDFRHLKDKRIAYMKSRPVGTMLKDGGADGHSITDLGEAFSDLADGKYDGVICYRFQAKYYMNQLHLEDELKADELSLEPREYCYASHNKQLIDSVNAELKRMEAEGVIDEVYGQDVVSQFGAIEIPAWVWSLMIFLTFLFLIIFNVNRYRQSRRLQLANAKLSEKNDALLIANAKAEESTRMKSAFIKQISHEIRTPLNIMSGFTQLLATPGNTLTDAEKKEASEKIVESTNRITGLVNKMLELSEVSSHTVLERTDEVTPKQIAQEAIQASGIELAHHVKLDISLEDGADTPFHTHQRSAVRILELLLDNAMKFTHPAEATLAQQQETTAVSPDKKQERVTLIVGSNDQQVCFAVEDTGIGIPIEEAERIFDEFVQLDEYYDGTGIGLTVARNLARRLGGDIMLDTSNTTCTRFVITLGR